ncbi:MAG: DUF2075 domain-containing protein [Nitriliruptoraceae bacterium]
MAELYWGTTSGFVETTKQNLIADRLRSAFFDSYGWNPPESEIRSWRNSLRALSNAIELGGFLDHGMLLEFQLPLTSKRLDAMITGHDRNGHPAAVIVELKQWSDDVQPSSVEDMVAVRYGKGLKETLHPSAQVGQYRQYLADAHEAFHDGNVLLRACSYLHDFHHDDQSELLAPRHANLLGVYPLFAGDRVTELVEFLDNHLGDGRGLGVLRTVREGKYRPHKKLLDHTAAMIQGEPAYVLLDEQQEAFKSILAKVAETRDLGTKAVFVIRGGPGTGKSVIALNLVAELAANEYAVHHATGSAAFTNTVRKRVGPRASGMFKFFNSYLNAEDDVLDVLICDEAHRIRKHSWDRFRKKNAIDPDRPQIDELLSVARVCVFFIDDMQAVKRDEIGNSNDIERLAAEHGAEVHEHELQAQFRCGGSDGFVRWVESTLGIRRTANQLWTGDSNFDFDIVDSVEELDDLIRQRADEGHSARLVAGYCWPWSGPRSDGTLELDVRVDGWGRPWNARPDATGLAQGIPKSHFWASEPGGIDQVGCIYTAQGFEFDYAGVIFGNDLVYRPREGWVGQKDLSYDGGLKRGTTDEDFTRLVKNTYRVLLSRGLKGCYVYFTDEKTRDFVESRIDSLAIQLAAEQESEYGSDAP